MEDEYGYVILLKLIAKCEVGNKTWSCNQQHDGMGINTLKLYMKLLPIFEQSHIRLGHYSATRYRSPAHCETCFEWARSGENLFFFSPVTGKSNISALLRCEMFYILRPVTSVNRYIKCSINILYYVFVYNL